MTDQIPARQWRPPPIPPPVLTEPGRIAEHLALAEHDKTLLIDAMVDAIRRHTGLLRLQVYLTDVLDSTGQAMACIGEPRFGVEGRTWVLDHAPLPVALAERISRRYAEVITPVVDEAWETQMQASR